MSATFMENQDSQLARALDYREGHLPERRNDKRHSATYRPCCVVTDGRILLGLIRNFSRGGAQIDIDAELNVGDRVSYFCEMQALVSGRVAWRNGKSHGIENLEERGAFQDGYPARSVRVPCRASAKCWIGGIRYDVEVENISLGGMRIKGVPKVEPGTLSTVNFCGLDFELANIRWAKDGFAGLRFSQRISREALAQLLLDQNFGLAHIQFDRIADGGAA